MVSLPTHSVNMDEPRVEQFRDVSIPNFHDKVKPTQHSPPAKEALQAHGGQLRVRPTLSSGRANCEYNEQT